MRPPHPAGARQRGAVLMLMLVILVMGISAVLISSLNVTRMKNARQQVTAEALARAKEALIGYAITYGDTHPRDVHGYLPCPDIDGNNGLQPEGSAEYGSGSLCSNNNSYKNVSTMGRLPWKTLGLSVLRDGDGECLWYAVSGTYKNSPQTGLMNWDNNGQFQAYAADGTRLDSDYNQVVAVVFAPGSAFGSQNRTPDGKAPVCGGNYTASAYLDNDTARSIDNASVSTVASAVSKFIQGKDSGEVNDRMVFITRQDLWNAMLKRSDFTKKLKDMTKAVAECLADYGNNNDWSSNHSLPWPAPLQLSLGDYAIPDNYNNESGLFSGRVPHRVYDSKLTSNNDMNGTRLMYPGNGLNCPHYSASPSNELERLYPWWDNWKDHLFYALSKEYRPREVSTGSCYFGDDCVRINGSGYYAGVVIFAGSALTGQNRASTTSTNSERGTLSNYLEGRNESNYPNYGGNDNYQTEAASSTFNDILYCIRTDLNVIECPLP